MNSLESATNTPDQLIPVGTELEILATGRIYVKTIENGCVSEWREKQHLIDAILISDRKARNFNVFRFVDSDLESQTNRF